jgi:hypothetical protein
MSFFSKIASVFGGGSSSGEAKGPSKEHMREIAGLRVFATPQREGAQFRLAGRIEKDQDGVTLTREFVRADLFTTEDDVVEVTFRKAEQIISQNGKSLFADGAPTGRA